MWEENMDYYIMHLQKLSLWVREKTEGERGGCPTQVILWTPEADRVIFQTKDTMESRMICGY